MVEPPEQLDSPGGAADLFLAGEIAGSGGFQVELDQFAGPFDLLLQLISRQELDITVLALAAVTDEFIAYMRAQPDLSQISEFLVVAATLLDLKAARLLPREDHTELEDLALLEAQDLLFSRLLQYRAFKQAAAVIRQRMESTALRFARDVPLEPQFAALLPELVFRLSVADFAHTAAQVFSRGRPEVSVLHLHEPLVPVAGQIRVLCEKLTKMGELSFTELVADATSTAVVVSRFLGLLELFRAHQVEFIQEQSLSQLRVLWIGDEAEPEQIELEEYEGDRND